MPRRLVGYVLGQALSGMSIAYCQDEISSPLGEDTNMQNVMSIMAVAGIVMACVSGASADVFDMGSGLTSLDTVTVGNVGNAADSTGYGAVNYAYNIGKYEVTNSQYCEFLNAVAASDPKNLYNTSMGSGYGGITRNGVDGSYTYSVIVDRGDKPVNYVSWGDAVRFVNWLTNGQGSGDTETGAYALNGAMSDAELLAVTVPDATQRQQWAQDDTPYYLLPDEDEWYKAAYHKNDGDTGNYFNYPTSSDLISTADANYDNSVGDTTDVGSYFDASSPYGTFDQGGNVLEWHEALVGSCRGMRGGALDHPDSVLDASYPIGYHVPTFEVYGVGFRVVQVPEPTSFSLLSLGGLVLMRRRKPQA